MEAVILAAGEGRRLWPMTAFIPKPLIRVGGEEILKHTLCALPRCVQTVHIVVGYMKEAIQSQIGNSHLNKVIIYHVQSDQVGTAAALVCVKKSLAQSDRFIVLCGDDMYDKDDLSNLIKQPVARGVVTDKRQVLIGTGAYVLNHSYFNYPMLQTNDGEGSLPHTAAQMPDLASVIFSRWVQINTPEQLAHARKHMITPSVYQDDGVSILLVHKLRIDTSAI